jgi:hypothetical protein
VIFPRPRVILVLRSFTHGTMRAKRCLQNGISWALMLSSLCPNFGLALCPLGKVKSERKMVKLGVSVNRVAGFEPPSPNADGILRLRDGNAYAVDRVDPRLEIWSRMIRQTETSARALYIEFDPTNRRIHRIFQPSLRRVESVGESPEGNRLKVTFLMAPSAYFVYTTRPDYAALRRLLEQHLKSRGPLLVTEDPGTQEVLDAREPLPDDK